MNMAFHPMHIPAAPQDPAPGAVDATLPWQPCGTCWGQGRIWSWSDVAECLVPFDCPHCRGFREVPSVEGLR